MFRFADPWFFALLVLLPGAWGYRRRTKMAPALGVSAINNPIASIRPSGVLKSRGLVLGLKYLAVILLIAALARPQWGTRQVSVMTEGVNIVLAVDLSESMAALDFRKQGKIINRLEAVKDVVEDFVAKREGDRIGMAVFGSQAYTQLPLTRDYNTLVSVLERLEIGAAGPKTAIGDAIGIALKRLADIPSQSNVIILLTDGESNAGEIPPETAAQIAREKGVTIYTIGVGTRGEAPFLMRSPLFGERYVTRKVTIDEKTLKSIAEMTGGLYFRAEDTEGLREIYNTIDRLEKTEVAVKQYARYNDLYPCFLLPGLLLLALWCLLVNTRYLEVP